MLLRELFRFVNTEAKIDLALLNVEIVSFNFKMSDFSEFTLNSKSS